MNCDTPKHTKIDLLESLNSDDLLAVDLAAQCHSYREIAEALKVKPNTVKQWFRKKGRLYEALKQAKKERREEYEQMFAEVNDFIRESALEAVRTLRAALKKNNMVGVMAAKDILDRAGFKAKEEPDDLPPTKVNTTIVIDKTYLTPEEFVNLSKTKENSQ